MEAVALASTFATLIGFSIQLYGIARYYVDAARGACPHDFKLILIETASLQATLESVKTILDASDTRREDEAKLQKQIGDTVLHCTNCIKELVSLLPPPMVDDRGKMTMKDKATIIAKAVRWGASNKKGRCNTLLDDLSKYKANLGLGLTVGLTQEVKQIRSDVSHVKSSINTMQAHLNAAQRDSVHRWLEQINPSSAHNAAGHLHESQTGQWVVRTKEWQAWANEPVGRAPRLLWIHGIPGAGKTVLAYSMIEQVKAAASADRTKSTAAVYYYCHHGRNKDETASFLSWIVSQLCRKSDYIPEGLMDLYNEASEPTIKNLLDCLEAVVAKYQRVYVVLDAVDESNPRKNLLKALVALGSEQRFSALRLTVTSREYEDIEAELKPRSISLSMNNRGVYEDISTYTDSTLNESTYRSWGPLRAAVAKVINEKAHGMFRYAACQLDVLAGCDSTQEVERELRSMPKTLNDIYERILLKIEDRSRGDAVTALALIMAAMDQSGAIHADTLVTAMAGGPGVKTFWDINKLRRICLCLISVREDASVYLAHYTVREFLQGGYVQKKMPSFFLPMPTANSIYYGVIMKTVAQITDVPASSNVPEHSNGDPRDYRHFVLRRTRIALYWGRDDLARVPENRKMLFMIMNPYHPSFPALQIMGADSHSDTSHHTAFEWMPRWSTKVDSRQKAAAHLTMLVSLRNPDIIKEFLSSVPERDRAALFGTQMRTRFPIRWESFRKNGHYDSNSSLVTVLQFYEEGQRRGYDTSEELKLLKGPLSRLVQAGASAAGPPSLNAPPSSGNSRPRAPSLAVPPLQAQQGPNSSPRRTSGAISPGPVASLQRSSHVSRTSATTSGNGNASTSNSASTSRRTAVPPQQQQAPPARTTKRTTDTNTTTTGTGRNTSTR